MATTTGHLTPPQRKILKIVYAFLSVIAIALFAFAYSKKSHDPNVGRGAFDRTTEGAGPIQNP